MPQPAATIELVQEAELRGWRFTPVVIHVKNAPKWVERDWCEVEISPHLGLLLKLYWVLFIWKVLGSKAAKRKLLKYLASVNLHYRKEIAKYTDDPMWFIEERLIHGADLTE